MASSFGEKAKEKVKYLVADAGAFLKNVPLQDICEHVYTIQEVVNEIRDKATRQRLAVLPYVLHFREPSPEAYRAVTEFAKLTGDFRSLSAVDVKVMALTYHLEKEHCGIENIRTQPTRQVEFDKGVQGRKMPGFYVECESKQRCSTDHSMEEVQQETGADESPSMSKEAGSSQLSALKDVNEIGEDFVGDHNERSLDEEMEEIMDLKGCSLSETASSSVFHQVAESSSTNVTANELSNSAAATEPSSMALTSELNSAAAANELQSMEIVGDASANDEAAQNNNSENDEGFVEEEVFDGDDDFHEDDDDDEGWITPGNISKIKAELQQDGSSLAPADVTVGCMTTDFAIQNVLIQMGLHVVSTDGMLIKEAKSYVLKCYGCFKVSTRLDRRFCPACGNKTLVKVAISVDSDGVTHYHMPTRKRPFNVRGKRFPLPHPKGGRHDDGPILCEDQPRSQRRLPRKRDKVDVFDPNYTARASPFATNDVTSRASQLGFHMKDSYQSRRNPNEVRKKSGRRKK